MVKRTEVTGAPARAVPDVVTQDFDTDFVNAFFNGGEKSVAQLVEFGALDFPGGGMARSILESLGHLDPQATEPLVEDPLNAFNLEDGAYAKPAHAGGGKTDGGSGVKGGGRGKDKTPPADTDTGDSGDGGSTTPDPTPEPEPTPDPSPTYSGEYVSGLDTPDGFNIEVEFRGDWTSGYKQALYAVLEKVSDFITGDLPSYNGIDDFKLTAIINAIDGTGGYMGVGGTTVQRPGSYLPSEGFFRFDEADIQNKYESGLFKDIVMHEVLHAMGFGTIWEAQGLVKTIDGQKRFIGENAVKAYNELYPDIAASDPYSDQGVRLTSDGAHWHHATFTREMMTSSLYPSGNYLSDMSIAALEDMGYQTSYAQDLGIA